jgi:hypothetical protein
MLYFKIEGENPKAPHLYIRQTYREISLGRNNICMRKAVGYLIVLWGLSHFFGQAMSELDKTATASLKVIGVAAEVAQTKLIE